MNLLPAQESPYKELVGLGYFYEQTGDNWAVIMARSDSTKRVSIHRNGTAFVMARRANHPKTDS